MRFVLILACLGWLYVVHAQNQWACRGQVLNGMMKLPIVMRSLGPYLLRYLQYGWPAKEKETRAIASEINALETQTTICGTTIREAELADRWASSGAEAIRIDTAVSSNARGVVCEGVEIDMARVFS